MIAHNSKIIGEGLTYDDVLLVPNYSNVLPREVSIQSKFSRNITLNVPIVSAAMEMPGDNTRKFNFMEAQAGLLIAKLRNRVSYLGVIVTMSPLLGLLGTIVGMINSFSIFNIKSGQPMAITGGIGEALIATATGLCVAIIALGAHSYFAQRLDSAITNMEQCFSALLEAGSRGGRDEA